MRNLTWDELQRLSIDELKRLCMEVRSKINRRKRLKKASKELEIYFCYVIRALEKCANVQHS